MMNARLAVPEPIDPVNQIRPPARAAPLRGPAGALRPAPRGLPRVPLPAPAQRVLPARDQLRRNPRARRANSARGRDEPPVERRLRLLHFKAGRPRRCLQQPRELGGAGGAGAAVTYSAALLRIVGWLAPFVLLVAACGESTAPPPPIAAVTIVPESVEVVVHGTV